jgi:L-2-hydroxyglutarate oxidase LhgO
MERAKIVIIGAGVIGLAVADALSAKLGDNIVVFEKNLEFGQEISSRNSEVIHAGIYYPKGSFKSTLCLKGNHLLYRYCAANKIKYQRCGKLIVSTNELEAKQINQIHKNGINLGVPGIHLLNQNEIRQLEPEVFGLNGIHSETTGIIDSHGLMSSLFRSAQKAGALFSFGSEVKAIKKNNRGYIISTKNEEIAAETVINCAGLLSDQIAARAGMDINRLNYTLHYCKGDYFSVAGSKGRLAHLVYPVPQPEGYGLGIHATLDLHGYLHLGPDTAFVHEFNYDIDPAKRKTFCASAKTFLPWLEEESLSPDTAGIRPKLQGPGENFRDFIIKEEAASGFPGFINLIGIESPGLTASLAIGKYVAELVR